MDSDNEREPPAAHATSANRIQHLLMVGQTRRARELAAEAVARNPEDVGAMVGLSRVLLQLGEHAAALQAARQACRLAPENDIAHHVRGLALQSTGRFREAEQALLEALRLDPNDAVHHYAYAALLATCERKVAALQAVDRALLLDPDDADYHDLRARLLLAVSPSDWQISEPAVRRALELDPDNGDAHATLGLIELRAGRRRDAEHRFRAALELQPDNQLALHGLAHVVMAESLFYRPFLAYSLLFERFSVGIRVAVVMGLWAVVNIASQSLPANSAADRYLTWGYIAFCAYTWFAAPVMRWILARRYPWLREIDV